MNLLRLRNRTTVPGTVPGTVALFADEEGALKEIDGEGTVTDVGAGGGSQPQGVLQSAEFLFTEQATADNVSIPILAVDQGTKTFTVADASKVTSTVRIVGSTGNDGVYTVASLGVNVEVNEAIPSPIADGAFVLGEYTAELPIPAGSAVVDVAWWLEADWAADIARLNASDSSNDYFDRQDVKSSAAFGWNSASVNYGNPGAYVGPAAMSTYGVSAADETLALAVQTVVTAPPVVPTGVLHVRVLYMTPPATVTDATFA